LGGVHICLVFWLLPLLVLILIIFHPKYWDFLVPNEKAMNEHNQKKKKKEKKKKKKGLLRFLCQSYKSGVETSTPAAADIYR
jgi:hypothetical protein